MGTVEKLTPENMGTAFGILSLEISDNISETVQNRHSYNGKQIRNQIWPIERHICR